MWVRQRRDDDLDQLVAVATRVHATDGYPIHLPDGDVLRFLQRPPALDSWVAVDGSRVVGHIALNETTAPAVEELVAGLRLATPAVFVARLLVDPEARRRGVGRRLLDKAAGAAHDLGRSAFLDVVDTASARPAIALYRAAGWEQVGRVVFDLRSDTPREQAVHEIVFRAPIPADEVRFQIRRAIARDAASVRACVNEAYEPYQQRIGRAPAPMLDDYERLIDDGSVYVAVRDDEIGGVVVGWANHDHFFVDNVATNSATRGSGLGRQLMDSIEQRARDEGCDEVRLYTNVEMTDNVAYYERRGYVETHRSAESGYDRIYFTKAL